MKTHYRFFFLDESGHIVKASDGEHADDLDALDKSLVDGHAIEVWTGGRRVALVKKDNAPLDVHDRSAL